MDLARTGEIKQIITAAIELRKQKEHEAQPKEQDHQQKEQEPQQKAQEHSRENIPDEVEKCHFAPDRNRVKSRFESKADITSSSYEEKVEEYMKNEEYDLAQKYIEEAMNRLKKLQENVQEKIQERNLIENPENLFKEIENNSFAGVKKLVEFINWRQSNNAE